LADALTVKLTKDPQNLARVLKKVGGYRVYSLKYPSQDKGKYGRKQFKKDIKTKKPFGRQPLPHSLTEPVKALAPQWNDLWPRFKRPRHNYSLTTDLNPEDDPFPLEANKPE
jgi:hypothetical protein